MLMSSKGISVRLPKPLITPSNGGMRGKICILVFRGWLWITLLYQVCRDSIVTCAWLTYSLFLIATSVSVERVFSQGRILLSHIRNRLSAESTRALLCLGEWSKLGLVDDKDILAVTQSPEVEGIETLDELESGWDRIIVP